VSTGGIALERGNCWPVPENRLWRNWPVALRRVAAALIVVAAFPIQAQVVFSEGFEAVDTENAAAPWTFTNFSPVIVRSRPADAAHSGDAGMRFDIPASGARGNTFEYALAFSGTAYVRGFVRFVGSDVAFSPFVSQATSIGTIGEMTIQNATAGQSVDVRSSTAPAGTGITGIVRHPITAGEWHLFEYLLTGIGTATGACTAALDGVIFETVTASWLGVQYRRFRVGTSSGYAGAAAIVDFDDVLVATAPLYARLLLEGTDAGAGCTNLTGRLAPSTFPNAAFPAPVFASLAAVDGGLVSCGNTTTTGTLGTPASVIDFGPFSAGGSGARVRLSSPGLAWAELDLAGVVAPDAGPGVDAGVTDAGVADAGVVDGGAGVDGGSGRTTPYALGCDCSHGFPAPAAFGLLLLLVAARPSRRRP
jgi:uncharacterized protein (TIGR03382 family)